MSYKQFQNLDIWSEFSINDALYWYRSVSCNEKPAKYLICRRIPCTKDYKVLSSENLWEEHMRLTSEFLKKWKDIREDTITLNDLQEVNPSLLDLSTELAYRMLNHCTFCQWRCGVNRTEPVHAPETKNSNVKPKLGTCQLNMHTRVGSYFHHRGEELIYRGTNGSGTIFFTSCNMRCGFCQNGDISHDKDNGLEVTPAQLAVIMIQLRLEGVHNINLVGGEPTMHLHTILDAINRLNFPHHSYHDLDYIKSIRSDFFLYPSKYENTVYENNFNVPILWNSNFFMSMETMALLRPIIDIWLPDFKFGSDKCAIHLSRTPRYFDTVTQNLNLIYQWGEDFSIRHLIMPNHVECCTKPILDWIKQNMPDALINIMDQYHPDCFANPFSPDYHPKLADVNRYPTKKEILESFAYAKKLNLVFEPLSYEKNSV